MLATALVVASAVLWSGCGPSLPEDLTPVSYAGGQPAASHPLTVSGQGVLYLTDVVLEQGELVVGVVDVGGRLAVSSVFEVIDGGLFSRVAKVSSVGSGGVVGVERYLPLDELPDDAIGLHITTPPAVTDQSLGQWYWVLDAPGVDGPPSGRVELGRVVDGIAVVTRDEGSNLTVRRIGSEAAIDPGARLVEIWPRLMVTPGAPLRIAVVHADTGEGAWQQARDIADAISNQMMLLGVEAHVILSEVADAEALERVELRGVADALAQDVLVVTGRQPRVVARPAAFQVGRVEPEAPLMRISLVEHAVLVPDADPRSLVNAALGTALLRGASVALGAWLLEQAAAGGATLGGSEMAMRWRLTEAYALARHEELARETIAWLGSASESAAADAVRYRARLAHVALLDGASPEAVEAALIAYDQAAAAYAAIGFGRGEADVLAQKAWLQLATGSVDAALATLAAAALGFVESNAPGLAGRVELESARLLLASQGLEQAQRVRELLMAARTHFEVAGDTAGVARVAAWEAIATDDGELLTRRLDEAMATFGTGSTFEPVLVLGEGRRESLSGRQVQARASYLDAARRALTDQPVAQVAPVALSWFVASLDAAPPASGARARYQEAAMLAAQASGLDMASAMTMDDVQARACAAVDTASTPGSAQPMNAYEACRQVAAAALRSESLDEDTRARLDQMLAGLVAALREASERGWQDEARQAARELGQRLAVARSRPGDPAQLAGLIVALGEIETDAAWRRRRLRVGFDAAEALQVRLESIDQVDARLVRDARLTAGEFALELGETDLARARFEQVTEADARDTAWARAIVGLALLEAADGRPDAGQARIAAALTEAGGDGEVRDVLEQGQEALQ